MGTLHEACCQPSPPSPAHAPPPAKMGLRGQCLSLAMAALRSAIPVRVTSGAWDMSMFAEEKQERSTEGSSGPRPPEAGKIRDIWAGGSLRNRQHPLSQEARTLVSSQLGHPSRTHQVTLCHSHLRQAASWARTVFSNCRSQPASGL